MGKAPKTMVQKENSSKTPTQKARFSVFDLLLPAGVLAVGVSVALAYFGYVGREEQVIGVDLGTTFSVVAVARKGWVEVINNYQSNKKTTPSCVTFHPNGTTIVGDECIELRKTMPHNSIFNAKRFIGMPWHAVEENKDLLEYPFHVEDHSEYVKNLPKKKGVERIKSQAWFRVPTGSSSKMVAPEEVGAEILKVLKDSAARKMGRDSSSTTSAFAKLWKEETKQLLDWQVSKAVACVPADFSGPQRLATRKAFELAGLTVVRMMEEPTCAAVAYNLDLIPQPRHILVYDIGGGTLDCSLLFMNGDGGQTTNRKGEKKMRGSITVLGSEGDPHFGGSDFDEAMLNLLKHQWEGKLVGDLGNCADEYLRINAEESKIALSSVPEVEVECKLGNGEVLSTVVTRELYEEVCAPLYDRALLPVDRILDRTDKEEEDINFVVLVGGASRLPMLKHLLANRFGQDKLRDDIDPDLTVAIGAATIVD